MSSNSKTSSSLIQTREVGRSKWIFLAFIASNGRSSAALEEELRRKMKYGGHGCCFQSTLNYYYHKNFFRTASTQTQFLSEPQQDPHFDQGYKQSGRQEGLGTAELERSSTTEAIDNNIVATSARCKFSIVIELFYAVFPSRVVLFYCRNCFCSGAASLISTVRISGRHLAYDFFVDFVQHEKKCICTSTVRLYCTFSLVCASTVP
jgi:hypothetical protein